MIKLTRGNKDTITDTNFVYLDKTRVGKVILDGKTPYFRQLNNFSLRPEELELVANLMRNKYEPRG